MKNLKFILLAIFVLCMVSSAFAKDSSSAFDHTENFPLTGVHDVYCSKCHDSEPMSHDKYTCLNCHEHATRGIEREHREEGVRGFFGDCLRCHQVRIEGRRYGTRKVSDSMIDDDDDDRNDRYDDDDHDDDDDDDHYHDDD